MAFEEITYVSTFTIGKGEDDWAVYEEEEGFDVPPGTEEREVLAFVQRFSKREQPIDRFEPKRDKERPERNLDIYETKQGKCLYIFKIAEKLRDRLRFVQEQPFITLPLNSDGDMDTFITDWGVLGENGFEAYFVCDCIAARKSNVAKEIRDHNENDRLHGLKDILNIPFTFNVKDPLFKAAPWVVPGHEPSGRHRHGQEHSGHSHGEGHSHGHGKKPDRTHGGVHPPMKSVVSVEL